MSQEDFEYGEQQEGVAEDFPQPDQSWEAAEPEVDPMSAMIAAGNSAKPEISTKPKPRMRLIAP